MSQELSESIAKDRRRLASRISWALLGPIVGKMPKSSIESLEKASYLPNIQRHIVEILPVSEARVVRHDVDGAFPPFIRREAIFGKRNLYLLDDAVVSPHSGLAWIENKILEESVGSLRRIMDWGDVLHEPLLPVAELQLREPVVVCHPATYYHWLLEVLPNLLVALERFPDLMIVVPDRCPHYVMDGLATAIGPEAANRFVPCSSPVRVRRLLMPQYHSHAEFTDPQVLDLLKSQVKPRLVGNMAASGAVSESRRRIYISRRRSRRRRLVGEELLEGLLSERGFTILHCEELSFAEQVRVFHEAEVVVGTHGAGLSNLVWCQAPCRVIEIFPKNYILDCFAWLSFSLGLDYRYVICNTGHRMDEDAIRGVIAAL